MYSMFNTYRKTIYREDNQATMNDNDVEKIQHISECQKVKFLFRTILEVAKQKQKRKQTEKVCLKTAFVFTPLDAIEP